MGMRGGKEDVRGVQFRDLGVNPSYDGGADLTRKKAEIYRDKGNALTLVLEDERPRRDGVMYFCGRRTTPCAIAAQGNGDTGSKRGCDIDFCGTSRKISPRVNCQDS
jgi:hypothetical protein